MTLRLSCQLCRENKSLICVEERLRLEGTMPTRPARKSLVHRSDPTVAQFTLREEPLAARVATFRDSRARPIAQHSPEFQNLPTPPVVRRPRESPPQRPVMPWFCCFLKLETGNSKLRLSEASATPRPTQSFRTALARSAR